MKNNIVEKRKYYAVPSPYDKNGIVYLNNIRLNRIIDYVSQEYKRAQDPDLNTLQRTVVHIYKHYTIHKNGLTGLALSQKWNKEFLEKIPMLETIHHTYGKKINKLLLKKLLKRN